MSLEGGPDPEGIFRDIGSTLVVGEHEKRHTRLADMCKSRLSRD